MQECPLPEPPAGAACQNLSRLSSARAVHAPAFLRRVRTVLARPHRSSLQEFLHSRSQAESQASINLSIFPSSADPECEHRHNVLVAPASRRQSRAGVLARCPGSYPTVAGSFFPRGAFWAFASTTTGSSSEDGAASLDCCCKYAFAIPTARARTRAITPTRSVTEIAPRASRMLKRCEHLRHRS